MRFLLFTFHSIMGGYMLDVVAIGNISADLYFSADELTKEGNRLHLAIGGKYRASWFEMHVGGGGANVSIGCAKQGLRAAAVGMVGNNIFRKSILQRLKLAKVSRRYISFNQKDASVSIILLDKHGERTIIKHQSSHKHSADEKYSLRHIQPARVVYFGNMPDVSALERARVMKRLKVHNSKIVCNLGIRDCTAPKRHIDELLEHADVLIVNTYEFAEMVRKKRSAIDFKKSIFSHMPKMKDRLVVVTDSASGSYGYLGDKVHHQKAIKPRRIVDTTGAGDAYTSGFITSYIMHEDIPHALKKGAQAAAKILTVRGAN